MPSVEELRDAEGRYAAELGYMVMEAAAVEMEVRFIAITLAEPLDPRLHARLKSGWGQASRIADKIRELAPGHFTASELDELFAALKEALELLDHRGDLVHSTWPQSIFDETPEPARMSQRGLKMHRTSLSEIFELTRRLRLSRSQLAECHSKLFLFVPWSELEANRSKDAAKPDQTDGQADLGNH
jgi:hypothetical protein